MLNLSQEQLQNHVNLLKHYNVEFLELMQDAASIVNNIDDGNNIIGSLKETLAGMQKEYNKTLDPVKEYKKQMMDIDQLREMISKVDFGDVKTTNVRDLSNKINVQGVSF